MKRNAGGGVVIAKNSSDGQQPQAGCLTSIAALLKGGADSPSQMSTAKALDETEKLLVKEMNELQIEERQQVYEDIHGVADVVPECPAFINRSIIELTKELSRIGKKPAYDRALFMRPEYVEARDFRIKFLRSERFDAKKTAVRLVDHFQMKLELFGLDKLVKDITLDDLDEDDMSSLLDGSMQILPEKDRSGRSVICMLQKYQTYKHHDNQVKENKKTDQQQTHILLVHTHITGYSFYTRFVHSGTF
jgi:hypothetical protein